MNPVPTMPLPPPAPQPKLITLQGTRSLPSPDAAPELLTAAQHQPIKQGVLVKPGETVASVMKRTDFAVDGTLSMLHPVTGVVLGAREVLYDIVQAFATVRIVPTPPETEEAPGAESSGMGVVLEELANKVHFKKLLEELEHFRLEVKAKVTDEQVSPVPIDVPVKTEVFADPPAPPVETLTADEPAVVEQEPAADANDPAKV